MGGGVQNRRLQPFVACLPGERLVQFSDSNRALAWHQRGVDSAWPAFKEERVRQQRGF